MTRSIFNLKVSYRPDDGLCVFLLWDDDHRDMSATQLYSEKLERDYQFWRSQYLKFYNLRSPTSNKKSGSIPSVLSGDRSQDVRTAEQKLLGTFRSWLGEGDVHKIERRILDTLASLKYNGSTSSAESKGAYIDIYLTCDEVLEKLPWEIWAASLANEDSLSHQVRIVRTLQVDLKQRDTTALDSGHQLPRKPRVLAILAEDPHLPISDDWRILRSLEPIAHLRRVNTQPDDNADQASKKICAEIENELGWDVLYFAGHSDDSDINGGMLSVTSTCKLSISDIEDSLSRAQQNGLRLAILNSCCGLSIAKALVPLGIQTVIMREPIHNDFALRFLESLCQQLKQNDIHTSVVTVCQDIKGAEKFNFPSTYLVPSYFSFPSSAPLSLKLDNWTKRLLRKWMPTNVEGVVLTVSAILSLMVPVQDLLLDTRMLAQAVYRNTTTQTDNRQPSSTWKRAKDLFRPNANSGSSNDKLQDTPLYSDVPVPPISLVLIDQESIEQADREIPDFEAYPIDRSYLAKIISRLSELEAKVVGIDYFIETVEDPKKEEELATAISTSIETNNTQFVFASRLGNDLLPSVFDSNISLQGHASFWYWYVKFPQSQTCNGVDKICPFSFQLSLLHKLNNNLKNRKNRQFSSLQDRANEYFLEDLTFQKKYQLPLKLETIIDFSIPSSQVYEIRPAHELISSPKLAPKIKNNITQQVIIIAPGTYEKDNYDDIYSVPLAVRYWCEVNSEIRKNDCAEEFVGGKNHAYMVHHFLEEHRVIHIPDLWLVGTMAILGKGISLVMKSRKYQDRKQISQYIFLASIFYGIVTFQAYISLSILLPFFLPFTITWTYIIPAIRRGNA